MTALARTFRSPEGPVKAWLNAQGLAEGGVHIGTPTSEPATPWVTLFLVNAPVGNSDVPELEALIQFDCYTRGPKVQAADLAAAVVTALESIPRGTLLDEHTRCCKVQTLRYQPVPTNTERLSRYSVDIQLDLVFI